MLAFIHTVTFPKRLVPLVLGSCLLALLAIDAPRLRAQQSPDQTTAGTSYPAAQKFVPRTEPAGDRAERDAFLVCDNYFEAHDAAFSTGRHVLVYRFDADSASDAQVDFETRTLNDQNLQRELARQFVFAKLAAGDPIQIPTTVTRTSYIKRRFRRVKRTWTETVREDLFADDSNGPGLLVVRVTGDDYRSGAEAMAVFPFGHAPLAPHVFKIDRTFEPWAKQTFRKIVSTPVRPAAEYRSELSRRLDLQSPSLIQLSAGAITDLQGITYDYPHSSARVALDRVTLRIRLDGNSRLASLEDPIETRIDVYSLKDSQCPVQYVYRKLTPNGDWQDIMVDGLEPETAYRLRIYFYTPQPTCSLIGQAELPFHAATGGSTRLANARAAVAMRALSEVHDWRRGRTRGKDYLVGRWCERFYVWNIFRHFKTHSRYGYDTRTFSQHNAIVSGKRLRKMSREGNIMGDHVRVRGHGFMVLCYDRHLDQVWTIEGNVNNRVVLDVRRIQDYWSVGTLVESMLKEDDAGPSDSEELAAANESVPEQEQPAVEALAEAAPTDPASDFF